MTTDTDMLETNINNLERENRELRMTLRDQFAMAAMAGSRARNSAYDSWIDLALDSYDIADAMLEARK